jgi:hypothetical protein
MDEPASDHDDADHGRVFSGRMQRRHRSTTDTGQDDVAGRGRRAYVIYSGARVECPSAFFDVLVEHLDRRTVFRNRPVTLTVADTARVESEHRKSATPPNASRT